MMQQPMMQQPMMQQPVGIMASSPELMQASMGYNQGGPVQGYAGGKTVTPGNRAGVIIGETTNSNPSLIPPPTVDITQEPIEFQETVTETVGPETVGGFTEEGLAQEIKKYSDPFLNPDVPSEPKPEASDADTLSKAEQLGAQAIDNGELNPDTAPAPLADAVNTLNDPDKTPTEESDAILAGMGKNAPKGTKGKIGAMKDLIRDTFGVDASRYDNLKALNRAAVGFAIAKGDDIAAALERGAQGAAAIEEKSLARDDSMSQMALQQVFAEKLAGMRASRSGATDGSNKFRNPINAFQDALENAMRMAQDDVVAARIRKSGQTIAEWADAQARNVVAQSYTPDQLVGTRFAQPVEETDAVDITKPTATGGEETSVDVPTTPGVRFRDKETGKIMVVGEDGVAREE